MRWCCDCLCPSDKGPRLGDVRLQAVRGLSSALQLQSLAGPVALVAQGHLPDPQPLGNAPLGADRASEEALCGLSLHRKGPPLRCPDLQGTHTGPYLGHGQIGGACSPCSGPHPLQGIDSLPGLSVHFRVRCAPLVDRLGCSVCVCVEGGSPAAIWCPSVEECLGPWSQMSNAILGH